MYAISPPRTQKAITPVCKKVRDVPASPNTTTAVRITHRISFSDAYKGRETFLVIETQQHSAHSKCIKIFHRGPQDLFVDV